MVVTSGIERAIQYYHAIQRLPRRSARAPIKAIVAFSGEHEYGGQKVTEASLNGFPSSLIPDKIQEDPYRFLICADKFQTGYDEPLLHTMYVDKTALRHQGGADALAPQPRPPAEARRLRPRLPERRRHHPGGLRGLLPHDDPQRGDRPEQAPRPEGRRSTATRCTTPGPGRRSWWSSTSAAPTGTSSTRSSMPASPSTTRSSTRTARWTSRARPRRSCRTYGFLASILPVHQRRVGEALDLPELPRPQAAGAEGGGPLQGHPRDHRHGQLPRREAGGDEDRAARRGRRDRAGADQRRRTQARAGAGSPVATSSRPSTTSSATSPGRTPTAIRKLITEEIPAKVAADTAYQNAKKNSDKQNARIEHDKALGACHDRPARGRHRALQAVQRQRVVPPLADGHGVRADVCLIAAN